MVRSDVLTKENLDFIYRCLERGLTLYPIREAFEKKGIKLPERAVRLAVEDMKMAIMERRNRHWHCLLSCKKVRASDIPLGSIPLY